MRTNHQHIPRRRRLRRGLSLIEVTISTLLVGTVIVGSMKSLGSVIRDRNITSDSVLTEHLAQRLMTEIVNYAYIDDGASPVFGPEAEEVTGNRSAFDDVDDYDLWNASPPEDQFGTALPNLTGWQRDVAVDWVDPHNPQTVIGMDQGVKRITVTVRHDGSIISTLVFLRSDKYIVP